MAVFSSCEIIIASSGDGNSHLLHKETCEIVYDSILANKERTKSYWERLMVAAQGKPQRPALPAQTTITRGEVESFNHLRSASFDSMSSGNSSGSSDLSPVRNRSWSRPKDDSSLSAIYKETPIEKEIRISKEREEELKREKLNTIQAMQREVKKVSVSKFDTKNQLVNGNHLVNGNADVKLKQFMSPTDLSDPDVDGVNVKDEIRAELESISLKKCVSMSNLPMTFKNDNDSPTSNNSGIKANSNLKQFRMQASRQSLTNVTAPKLFVPSKGQKGLMKRFLESHGRMVSTFTLPQNTVVNGMNNKTWSPENSPVEKSQEPSPPTVLTRRPGYISAEDKIQMELKEMKQREAELKKERARLLGRSQPNLQKLEESEAKFSDQDDESLKFPGTVKLRSALSNPNLLATKPPLQKVHTKRRSALIDAWESRIRSTQ